MHEHVADVAYDCRDRGEVNWSPDITMSKGRGDASSWTDFETRLSRSLEKKGQNVEVGVRTRFSDHSKGEGFTPRANGQVEQLLHA